MKINWQAYEEYYKSQVKAHMYIDHTSNVAITDQIYQDANGERYVVVQADNGRGAYIPERFIVEESESK